MMKPQLPLLLLSLLPFGIASALPSRGQELPNATPVRWEPVLRSTAPRPQQPGGLQSKPAEEILWELVPESKAAIGQPIKPTNPQSEVVWSLVPQTPQPERTHPANAGGSASTQQLEWEVIPGSANSLGPKPSSTLATKESAGSDEPPADAVAFENSQPPRRIPAPPPPPTLQALNRSIAFGDGSAGPDIGWLVPNGFRWSRRWFADLNVYGQNHRQQGDDNVSDWGDGEGVGILHTNLLQTDHWSVALSTSLRSLQNNPNIPGGSIGIDGGLSSGFRIARSIGDTGGIALGAEQLIQWDDKTDTGRNLYLMASKGWWLSDKSKNFPLLIVNGGFGTGHFSWKSNLRFACAYNVEKRLNQFSIDNDLCWAPIGTVALLLNEYWSVFTEYSAGHSTLSASVSLDQNFPLRITWGVSFADGKELRETDEYRYTFAASISF